MSDNNGNQPQSTKTSDLNDLEQRLKAARDQHEGPAMIETDNSLLGMAWRISTELVVAVCIGCALGFGIDYFAGTGPIFIILGLVLGLAAGLRNTFRLVRKMEEAELARLKQPNE